MLNRKLCTTWKRNTINYDELTIYRFEVISGLLLISNRKGYRNNIQFQLYSIP